MDTFTTKIFVNNADQIVKDLERHAYGFTTTKTVMKPDIHEEHIYHPGVINEDDYEAIEIIDYAINMIYACEDDVAEITLPAEMIKLKLRLLQIEDEDDMETNN